VLWVVGAAMNAAAVVRIYWSEWLVVVVRIRWWHQGREAEQ